MAVKNEDTIIGIDGGGTRTRGVLYREGKIAARSFAGTTRVGTVGVGESCERLLNVISDLCEQSEIDSSELDAIVIGLAGVWLEEEKRRSTQLLKTLARGQHLLLNDLLVVSDAELALEGAFAGGEGIVLIVGTGSISVGRVGKDKIVRCGGWGIEIDDEGSGAWIGREGLTAVVRAIDGRGKATMMTGQLADLFPTISIKQPRTIVKAYSERSFEYQMLTPMVMQCAQKKDAVCVEIIQRSAVHLMELLMALKKHYKSKTVNVALMGGIIENDTLLSQLLDKEIKKNKSLKRVNPKGTAIEGAITLGKKLIKEME
jgi:glucosamine kinase